MDRGVLAMATELLEARHYPGVVAVVSDALEHDPETVELLLLRARAHTALRRDLDAQADLRDIIRIDPHCSDAYRMLGELAARRSENQSAAIFFREALRLDPGNSEARDWLAVVEHSARPAAVAQKLPAPAAAAGRFSSDAPQRPKRTATGSSPQLPAYRDAPDTVPNPTTSRTTALVQLSPLPPALAPKPVLAAKPQPTLPATPRAAQLPATPLPATPSPTAQATTRELPGFGDFLVASGILTIERLRAAQAYQRSMRVQLATAIVTLGLASPQRIAWAAVAHQSQLAREAG